MLPHRRVSRDRVRASERALAQTASGLLAAALVTGAFLMAPDNPEQRASICQQHNSAEACQVW